MKPLFSAACSLVVMGIFATTAHGQAPTGTIAGRVASSDGLPLPGVTVTATSPSLQGERMAVTSELGDYLIPFLPPGTYSVVFELSEFQKVERTQTVAGTQRSVADVTMSVAGVTASVQVVADAQPFVDTAQVATNFKQNLMENLPTTRTIDAVLFMAPAMHATGPRGAYTINGAQSYENVYTLNGAVINENLRGLPMTPYIEDALQEVTVSSAGVSAEYGRFAGGVANAITKSGGNTFSGSFRTTMANDSWRSYTPYELDQPIATRSLLKVDKTVPTYEGTFGGPISASRLWFFSAMRMQKQEAARTTSSTNIPYVRTNDEERYEGKLTYTARPGHSVQGSYFKLNQLLSNTSGFNAMDIASLANQGQPQDMYSVNYRGAVRPNFFVEAQYSARHLTFTDTGAKTTDRIDGTMIQDLSKGAAFRFWSPTFCSGSTCHGDEQRNNSNFVLKGSSFLSTRSTGSHHVVFGYDYYNDNIWANTHATGSDYRIRASGTVFRDGTLYPIFVPGTASTSTAIDYNPILELSEGSNLRTHALFLNDTWRPSNHLTFGLGLRLDKNQATDGGGKNVGDALSFSPRLSAIWDPAADGRWAVSASYARYVMGLTSNLAGSTTSAGNPATFRWFYQGPAINVDQSGSLVSTPDALRQLFAWFDANGGRDRRPYAAANVPGVNMTMREPLTPPYAHEYATGVSRTLGSRGTVRVDGVFRRYRNFYSLRTDKSTGSVLDSVSGNTYDLNVVENTDDVFRRYAALLIQGSYTAGPQLMVGGNYTLSHTYGNVDGETVNTGPSGPSINSYPEYRRAEWNYPEGDLSIDQRHRARAWATYSVPMAPSAGTLSFGAVQQMSSGVPYAAIGLINPTSFLSPQGYITPPTQLEYYFTDRDAFRTETSYRTDVSVNYAYRLSGRGGFRPELFFHAEVLNIFNHFDLCGCGDVVFNNGGASNLTTINQIVALVPTAPFNPYTTVPVEGVNWNRNANFGKALNSAAYTTPRLVRLSFGVRF